MPTPLYLFPAKRRLESAIFLTLSIMLGLLAFTEPIPDSHTLFMPHLVFLPFAWGALRMAPRIVLLTMVTVAGIAVYGAYTGASPLLPLSTALFLATIASVAIPFAIAETPRSHSPQRATQEVKRLQPPASEPIELPSASEPVLLPKAPAAHRSILIVDDNQLAAASLATLLNNTGHNARAANDGAQALTALGDFRPDMVFLDIGLPEKGAYEIAAMLRRYLDPTPILVGLTHNNEEEKEQAREAGFDAHLTKPVSIAELEKLLTRL